MELSFKMKAIINSDDPGVTQNGGKYEVTKESQFIKEFKEMAFTLEVGQSSNLSNHFWVSFNAIA